MREIKFRAWNNTVKDRVKSEQFLNDVKVRATILPPSILSINHDERDFMQYTWLKDKNWKEIYEGDIVKRYKDMFNPFYRTMVVRYDTMFPEFRLYKISNQAVSGIETIWEHFYWEHNNPNNLEVIWNIYEDKNLLTNK